MNRKILFKHKRALGDALLFTCGVRDFKALFPDIDINAGGHFPEVWENNPYIDRTITEKTEGVEVYDVGAKNFQTSNDGALPYSLGFLFDMVAQAANYKLLPLSLGDFTVAFGQGLMGDQPETEHSKRKQFKGITKIFGKEYPDIHLSEQEKKTNIVKDLYGVEKYWIVAPGGKSDCTCKIWDWRRFQAVIDHFDGYIKFVVIGRSDHIVEPLKNIINLVDKFNTNIRGLFSLAYHADGCVSGVSFLMHLAAGIPPRISRERKPCVAIYGGREPVRFTMYCNHQILHTNGVFSCCDAGGCWQSRTHPLMKEADKNKRLCHNTVVDNGRTMQACMDTITSQDVIRAIEKYYEGNIYTYFKPRSRIEVNQKAEINMLASLSSKGGGEQSACIIAKMLTDDGWKVNLYPWHTVHDNYRNNGLKISPHSFKDDMAEHIEPGQPLLFYGNDNVWDFPKQAEAIVNKSSAVIIGINWANGGLPRCDWLAKSGKLRGVIFQNQEKKQEWDRDAIGYNGTKRIVLYGAIDLDKYLEVCTLEREPDKPLIILKHCTPDYRKYVTSESEGNGEKIHLWQKNIYKEADVKFYGRMLKDTKHTFFEFMEAHKELMNAYKNEPRMVFHKWDAMPVTEFLARGHVYLYRTSNLWRDQYPRVVAEALASGLPVLSEPRDGTKDRMDFGNIGFHCIDYDGFLYALRLLQRKEQYRLHMGMRAKDWARKNLDPKRWVDVINELLER